MARESASTTETARNGRRNAPPTTNRRAKPRATVGKSELPNVVQMTGDQAALNTIAAETIAGDKVAGDKIESQINTAGAAVFLRAVQAQTVVGGNQITQYINYSSLPIVWPKHSEEEYLLRLHQGFTALLQGRKPVAQQPRVWDTGFVQPLLSSRRLATTSESGDQRTEETIRGTWSEIVSPAARAGVLVGEIHSGRSFLMRWIVADLARRASAQPGGDLPIYLPLSRFPFESADGLLDAAAFACGQQPQAMRDCWHQGHRRIFLAIDDVDQLADAQRAAFLRAVEHLNNSRGEHHSIVVSCRPGGLANQIQRALSRAPAAGATQWIILPLDDERIHQFLEVCNAEPWLQGLVED